MSEPTDVAEESAPEPVTVHGCALQISFGQQVLHVPRQRYIEVVKALLTDGYEMCADLTAVDYLTCRIAWCPPMSRLNKPSSSSRMNNPSTNSGFMRWSPSFAARAWFLTRQAKSPRHRA